MGLALVPLWIGLLAAYGLYTRDIKRISHSTVDDIPWMLHAVLVACLLTWVYFNVLPISKLGLLRRAAARRDRRGRDARAALAHARGSRSRSLGSRAGPLRRRPADGLPDEQDGGASGVWARADWRDPGAGQWQRRAGGGDPELQRPTGSCCASTTSTERDLLALVHRCRELSLKVSVLPRLFSALGPSVEVDDVEGVTVLGINPPVLPRSSRYMKRAFDLIATVLVLVLCAPLMALIALAIKLDSRGPGLLQAAARRKGWQAVPADQVQDDGGRGGAADG